MKIEISYSEDYGDLLYVNGKLFAAITMNPHGVNLWESDGQKVTGHANERAAIRHLFNGSLDKGEQVKLYRSLMDMGREDQITIHFGPVLEVA